MSSRVESRAIKKYRHRAHKALKAYRGKYIQLTGDLGSVYLRYIARADGTTDPVVVIVVNIVINAAVVVVALRHGGRAISVMDLIQIAYAHGGSDARLHHRYDLWSRKKEDRINFAKYI